MHSNYEIVQNSFIVGALDSDFVLTKLFRDEYPKKNPRLVLEAYFNDVYKLLLRKLAHFESESVIQDEEMSKLNSLFDEFKKVKKILSDLPPADKTDN